MGLSNFANNDHEKTPETSGEKPEQLNIDEKIETVSDIFSGEISGSINQSEDIETFGGIADWIADSMEQAAEKRVDEKPKESVGGENITINAKTDKQIRQTIEISAELYVEILEAITSAAAAWYSGDDNTDYSFEKNLKKRYLKIAQLYGETTNINVSPGFLFFAFTVLIIGQVGFKAHKRKGELLRAENFRRKLVEKTTKINSNGQTRLDFGGSEYTQKKTVKEIPNSNGEFFIPEIDRHRKDWQIDNSGKYIKDPQGNYLRKQDRKQRPSPELATWMEEMYRANLQYPTNKQIKEALKLY